MAESNLRLQRDEHNRVRAVLAEGMTLHMKLLSETDERRREWNQHAYCILTLTTPKGPFVIRDIQVVFNERAGGFRVRWRRWPTGREHPDRYNPGQMRKERLDVAGPLDHSTRIEVNEAILDMFQQIKQEAALGTLGHHEGLAQMRDSLQEQEAVASEEEATEEEAESQIEASV